MNEIEQLQTENDRLKCQIRKLKRKLDRYEKTKKIKKWHCKTIGKGEFFFLPCLYTSRWMDTKYLSNFCIGFIWLKFSISYETSKNKF